MGKLPNVTAEQLNDLDRKGGDLCEFLHGVNSRMEKGYVDDDIDGLVSMARSFLSLSRAAADTAHFLLHKEAMAEQVREIEALIRKRDAKT